MYFFLNLFCFVELWFWMIIQLEDLKKISSQRESGWPNSLKLRCNWVNSVRKAFPKYTILYKYRQVENCHHCGCAWWIFWGENKGYFLKVFYIFSIVLTWSFVKRANHCWHSYTEKSLNFIHYCTHYSSSKVHALKVILLCNSVNNFFFFFSCSSVFGDFFEQSSKLV